VSLLLQPWQQVGFQRHPSSQTAPGWDRVSRRCNPDAAKNSQSSWKTSLIFFRSLALLFISTCNSPGSPYHHLCMGITGSRLWRCPGTQRAAREASVNPASSQQSKPDVCSLEVDNTPCPGSTFNLLSVLRQFAPDLGAWSIPFNLDIPRLTWKVPEHKGGCRADEEYPAQPLSCFILL